MPKATLVSQAPGFGPLDDPQGVDALCLFIPEDERPLRGAAGWADWRLCGALSRLLQGGFFTGKSEDQLLLPSEGRVAFSRIFAVGLGKRTALDPASLSVALQHAASMLSLAKVRSVALEIPGAGQLEEAARAAAFTAKFLPAYQGEKVLLMAEKSLAQKIAA